MLKTTSVEVRDENLTQNNKKIQVEDQDKKKQIQISHKNQKIGGQKMSSLKSRSELKKQRPLEFRTWANEERFLSLELGKPLPNWGKRLLKLRYYIILIGNVISELRHILMAM